jgi:hypothetical protein
MGYDVYIYGEVSIKPERFDEALAALRAKALAEDGEPSEDSFEDLVWRFSHEHFEAGEDKNRPGVWTIGPCEDAHRHEEEAEDLFELLAPFIIDGGDFRFEGEDGEEWSWEFKDGKKDEDRAEKVWGGGAGKIDAFDEILKILYPKGKLRKFPKGTLDKLEAAIRKHGYGPLAGLGDLDALAKAAE